MLSTQITRGPLTVHDNRAQSGTPDSVNLAEAVLAQPYLLTACSDAVPKCAPFTANSRRRSYTACCIYLRDATSQIESLLGVRVKLIVLQEQRLALLSRDPIRAVKLTLSERSTYSIFACIAGCSKSLFIVAEIVTIACLVSPWTYRLFALL